MVATYPSHSHRARFQPLWRSTPRALGAVFAGSAMMFAAATAQGGSLLPTGDDVTGASAGSRDVTAGQAPAAPTAPAHAVTGAPQASTAAPGQATGAAGASGSPAAPGQAGAASTAAASGHATAWAPGAAPSWNTPLSRLPVHRAPVQPLPDTGLPTTSAPHVSTNTSSSAATADLSPAATGSRGTDGSATAPGDAAQPPRSGLVSGVLGGVEDLTRGLGL